ncbi:hypothetical protein HDU90_008146 [Geranomyces variabilis]|nr:hypothetical protein HDU90_008146 [Geranomyces variabilis]
MDVQKKQTHKTHLRNKFKKEPLDVNTLILYCNYFVLWDEADPMKAARDTLIKSCGLLKQDVNHNVVQHAKRLISMLDELLVSTRFVNQVLKHQLRQSTAQKRRMNVLCNEEAAVTHLATVLRVAKRMRVQSDRSEEKLDDVGLPMSDCTSEQVSTPAESTSSGYPEGQSVQTDERDYGDDLGRSPLVPRSTPESEDLEVMPQVASSGTIAAELWPKEYRRKMQQYLKSQAGLKDGLATSGIFDCGYASRSSLCEAGVLTRDEIRAFAQDFSKPFPEIPRAMREYLDSLSNGDALASWKEALDVVSRSGLSVPEKQLTRVCSEDPDVVRKAQSKIKKLHRKAQPGLDSMKTILVGGLESDLEYARHIVVAARV